MSANNGGTCASCCTCIFFSRSINRLLAVTHAVCRRSNSSTQEFRTLEAKKKGKKKRVQNLRLLDFKAAQKICASADDYRRQRRLFADTPRLPPPSDRELATRCLRRHETMAAAEICAPFAANVSGGWGERQQALSVETTGCADACGYVFEFYDACEGGGFITWTRWVICESSGSAQIALICLAVLYGLIILLVMGTATDDCLCTSIVSVSM